MQAVPRVDGICCSAIDYIRQLDSKNDPNSIALEYYGNRISRRDYWALIAEYRRAFLSLGIGAGDPVTICMLNSPEYEFIFFALLENGSIASTVSKSFLNADLKKQTIERGAKTLILSIEFVEDLIQHNTFMQLGNNSGNNRVERIIFTSSREYTPSQQQIEQAIPYHDIIRKIGLPRNIEVIFPGELATIGFKASIIDLPQHNLLDETATFSNTGGTTGPPKCAVHTHRAIISLLQSHDREVYKEFNLKEHSRSLLVIPISHITSQFYALMTRRAYGATIIYNPFSFEPDKLLDILINERIDDVTLPFGLYYAITRMPINAGDLLLQTPCCGGEPAPYLPTKEINSRLHAAGSESIIMGGGSTEFGSGILGLYGMSNRINETGHFFPYSSGFLIDPHTGNKITETGKRGILYAHAPWQMKEYLNDPQATDYFFNYKENGTLYGTNNDIAEIVGEFKGRPVYNVLGRADDFVLSGESKTYYSGIKMEKGRIIDTDFSAGHFLFDMRDSMLNIDGVMEVQPIMLPYAVQSPEGYPVANVIIRNDCRPSDILRKIYSFFKNERFAPEGIVFRTRFERSLSSDKREVISLLDERSGYYCCDSEGNIFNVSFPLGQEPKKVYCTDPDGIKALEPPKPKSVYSYRKN